MSDIAQLYPESPKEIPPDLTTPSTSYRSRVFLVLFCLILFLLLCPYIQWLSNSH